MDQPDQHQPLVDSNNDSFQALLSFECTGRGKKTPPVQVSISPVPTSVSDLKTAIQSKFSIPKSLQKISIDSGQTVLTDNQLLGNLYVRNSDLFIVTYLDRAEVKLFNTLNSNLCCLLSLFHSTQFCGKKGSLSSSSQSLEQSSRDVCTAFQSVIYSTLSPWEKRPTVEANRQYLIQENIIDNVIHLYSFLLEKPFDKREQFLQDLEICCMGLLWNFAETREARLYVVRKGAFELMMQSLLSCLKKTDDETSVEYSTYDVFDHSIGCVSNYSEIEQCQVPLASSRAALNIMLEFSVDGSSLNVFTKVLLANCLFRLSHNTQTHKYLLDVDILEQILNFFTKFKDNLSYATSMVIGYALSVMLSRLLSFSLKLVPPHLLDRTVEVLNTFSTLAQQVGWNKLTMSLEGYSCNWITVAPFFDVFFSPLHNSGSSNQEKNTTPVNLTLTTELFADVNLDSQIEKDLDIPSLVVEKCLEISVMSLSVEMSRSCHRRLAVEQGVLDCLVCLRWIVRGKWHDKICSVLELFRSDIKTLPVPRLYSMAAACLARTGDICLKDTYKF